MRGDDRRLIDGRGANYPGIPSAEQQKDPVPNKGEGRGLTPRLSSKSTRVTATFAVGLFFKGSDSARTEKGCQI